MNSWTNQKRRVCCDYLRSRTSVLELHIRTFPKFEAALFSTICARSDCTFIRMGNSLYGKGLNICNLVKLDRCWLIITSFWGSWHVEQTATLPVSGKPRLRTAGWLRTDFSGLRTDSRTTVRAAFWDVLRIFKTWFHVYRSGFCFIRVTLFVRAGGQSLLRFSTTATFCSTGDERFGCNRVVQRVLAAEFATMSPDRRVFI